MVSVDSPLVGPPSGTLHAAIDALGQQNAEYLTEMWRIATAVGLDPGIIAAQFHLETNGGTSERWMRNRNPAGLAVESDSNPDPATWTQTEAARVHVWALATMTAAGNPENWPKGFTDHGFRSRWTMKMTDDNYPDPIRAIADLQKRYVDSTGEPQAVWAWDDQYAAKLVARHRAIFGAGGTEPVGTPVIYDLMQDYARFGISQEDAATVRGYRFENRSGYKPSFIVLHIQVGTTRSSLDWWANGYVNGRKVTASSTVMIQKDGSILNVIPEQHGPWTNGDDRQPTANGQRLVNLPGNSNLHTLSIEAEGMSGADVLADADQLDAIEWQVRDWQSRYDIPDANVIRHGDVNSIDKADCPGAYYAEIMNRITGEDPVPQPTAAPIWWEPGDIGPQQRESDGAWALAMLGEVTAKRKVPVRVSADSSSTVIETLEIGDKRKLVGTGKYRNRWNFIEVAPGVYGRALWSAFHERFPTL